MTPFAIGPYTVHLLEVPGPGCALYAVFLGGAKIGQCVSLPGVSDCEWLERVQREQSFYAYSSAPLPQLSGITVEQCRGAAERGRRRAASRKYGR